MTTHTQVASTATTEDQIVTPFAARVLAVLRIAFGLTFLWAFFDKLFALGFSTGRSVNPETGVETVDRFGDAAWINGGSPTEGFLKFGADGPFKGFYNDIAGDAWANWLFMLGLLGIGLALTLGIGMRIADGCRSPPLRAHVDRRPAPGEQPGPGRPHPRRDHPDRPGRAARRQHLGPGTGLVADRSREVPPRAAVVLASAGTSAPDAYGVRGSMLSGTEADSPRAQRPGPQRRLVVAEVPGGRSRERPDQRPREGRAGRRGRSRGGLRAGRRGRARRPVPHGPAGGGSPGRARRQPVHRGRRCSTTRSLREHRGALRARAAAQPAGADRDPAGPGGLPGPAAGGRLRHRVLRRPAGRRRDVRPGPRAWPRRGGIRRYGMHGISHEYVAGEAARFLGRTARRSCDWSSLHLGNGASAAAIRGGGPVDTSMGLTPLEGLVMGTRAGDLDPGVLLHLLRARLRRRPARGPAAPPVRPAGAGRRQRLPRPDGRGRRRRRARADGVRRLLPPAPQVRRRLPRRARRCRRGRLHRRRRRARAPACARTRWRASAALGIEVDAERNRVESTARRVVSTGVVSHGHGARRADRRGAGHRPPGRRPARA